MIQRVWRRITKFLSSPALAVGLLVFVGVWSLLATLVAQGDALVPEVTAWAAAHPVVEPVARAVGLHQAFTSPVFIACILLLGVSTAVCAWRRTKSAISRMRTLRKAARADQHSLAESHDVEIACDPDLSDSQVLWMASQTLERLHIRTKHRDDLLASVSPPWSVWGSPIFHWALVAFVLVVLIGQMQRSDGAMAVAVGQTKADAPASYVSVHSGPWHDWSRVRRSIRVVSFDPDYKTGGIDRGAVPTVSVLDGAGRVIKTQRVYPNMMLHSGSLSINAPACGLSANLAFLDANGAEITGYIQPVDFSQTATEGTVPVGDLLRKDANGRVLMRLWATVPLDRVGGHFGEWIPKQPAARVLVTSSDGRPLLDRMLRPGEVTALPGGGSLRLVDIGWYSRLSIVDDWTTPFLYTAMAIAALGLSITLLARQQLLVASVDKGSGGARLVMDIRLWRNAPTSRQEIVDELASALGSDEEESTL